MDVACEWCIYLSLCTRLKQVQVVGNVCEVTEGRTLLVRLAVL